MSRLKDLRDFIAGLGITDPDNVYMGTLPNKPEQAIGVYHHKRQHEWRRTLGGAATQSFRAGYYSLLVHWNRSPAESEEAAQALFDRLAGLRDQQAGSSRILMIIPLYDPQDVGPDAAGVREWVIDLHILWEV